MIRTLAVNELRRAFAQPAAWLLLAVVWLVLAYFFLLALNAYLPLMSRLAALPGAPGVTDLVVLPLFRAVASVLLLVAPLLAMRSITVERNNATLVLLQASGAGEARIVIGKYLGMLAFLALIVLAGAAMASSLAPVTMLDLGRIVAGLLGLLLFAATLAALSVLAATWASQPALAAMLALALNLLLWMVDAGARYEGVTGSFVNYLALPTHLEPFLHGIVASVDVVYFALMAGVALILAARRLARLRERG